MYKGSNAWGKSVAFGNVITGTCSGSFIALNLENIPACARAREKKRTLAKSSPTLHLPLVMNARIGAVILLVVCAGLVVVLFTTRKKAESQKEEANDRIYALSNKWVTTSEDLADSRNVNVQLSGDLSNRNQQISALKEQLTQSEASIKAAQERIAQESNRVAELETQNLALDQRAMDLSSTITNLNLAIEETQRKLNAAEGDRAFLEKELQRLMAEKAELERQFNDLAVLRSQVKRLKEELAISRRLDWIRKGLFGAADQKGAELMMQQTSEGRKPAAEPKRPHYNLNVEVGDDGTIRVIPALTNNPAQTP
jgi:DNA repair exonuclease SbcCD ATPase subunit